MVLGSVGLERFYILDIFAIPILSDLRRSFIAWEHGVKSADNGY